MHPRRVVLTGFMGAGKSTVGRLLAPRLGWRFVDADDHIALHAGCSIAEIFSRHGEAHFRAIEAEVIQQLLLLDAAVIALGGGALEQAETRERIAGMPDTLLVYLRSSLATSLARCRADTGGTLRPVLEASDALETRFARRSAFYSAAHLVIDTDERSPDDVVQQLLAAWSPDPPTAP